MSRVRICCPNKGSIATETVQWLMRAFVQLAPNVEVDMTPCTYPLQHARNAQREAFLTSRCTHMFLLDSGKVPQEGTIQRLLAHDLSIVAAPHPTRKGDEVGLMVLDRAGSEYVQHWPLDGMQGPDVVVGCGGMLLRRDVVEAVGPWHCEYDAIGFLVRSEDFCFCDDAHRFGYEVWADCELVQVHHD